MVIYFYRRAMRRWSRARNNSICHAGVYGCAQLRCYQILQYLFTWRRMPWSELLAYNDKEYSVSGMFLTLIFCFLTNRFSCCDIFGACSSFNPVYEEFGKRFTQ
ncbi:hypothetical protein KC19_1G300200 [Ceratodon purpureus]|uniref:Uncharacterized protein n=1 Tax=Ceratodon purpureus TaxID=3225 RepID=A0A8T0JAV3_CERPU|nr:hypothetical protein KC19_1G300200 [Ceratodon purpureus]